MKILDINLIKHSKASKGYLIACIVSGLVTGILIIFQTYLLSLIISRLFPKIEEIDKVVPMLWGLLGAISLRGIFTWLSEWFAGKAALKIKTQLRKNLLENFYRRGVSFTWQHHSGELITVVTEGVESLDTYISQYLPQLALAGLIPAVIAAVVFPLDKISGIILILTAPLIPIFMILISDRTEIMTKRQWGALGRMSVQFLDTLQGLVTLKALNQSKRGEDKISRASDQYRKATLDVLQIAFLSALVLELVGTISTAIIAVGIGLRLLYGMIRFQEALFILFIAPEFYLPLRQLGVKFHAGISGVTASRRIFELLGEVEPEQEERNLLDWTMPEKFSLEFQSIKFSYPGKNIPIFSDLNLEIYSDELTAITGGSGTGKTTLFNLLLQFARPEGGIIAINNVPINSIPPEIWRNQISWISQAPYLFNRTILENIRMARPGASMAEVERAAKMANLKELFVGNEEFYETRIGERGIRLSGGQAQSVALARAFLKDAPILLLDEPTAMLDSLQEEIIAEATRKICTGRTVIVIAHRIKTVKNADRIIFIKDGRVSESGTHIELIGQAGDYFKMLEKALQ